MSKVDHACFRAHAALAPHLQLPVNVPGALGHALQSPMPGAHFATEHGRLDADFVVANANSIRKVASGDTGPLVWYALAKAKPSTDMAGRRWITRRYEVGEPNIV